MKSSKIALIFLVLLGCFTFIGCDTEGAADDPLRNADNNQVVNLGDSIFANSGDINNILYGYEGGTFRHYSRNGSQMIGQTMGMGKPIPDQYTEAKNDHADIKMVYMDGGINDFLASNVLSGDATCLPTILNEISPSCKYKIDGVASTYSNLLAQMAADGVERVIQLGYYHMKDGSMGEDDLNLAVDYLNAKIADSCNGAALDCTFIETKDSITDAHIISDGIHPSYEGSQILADLLWPYISDYLINNP